MVRHRSLRNNFILQLPTFHTHKALWRVERSLCGHHSPPLAVLLISIHTRIHVICLGHGAPVHRGHTKPVELRHHTKLRWLYYHELIFFDPLNVPLLQQIRV